MKKIIFILLIVIFIGAIALPAFAAVPPIVQCGTKFPETGACTLCDLLKLIKNIADFVIYQLTPIVATILILFAGVFIMINVRLPGTEGKIGASAGIGMIKSTVMGVILVLCAWLVANTFIQIFASGTDTAKSWFKLECTEPVFEDLKVLPSVKPAPSAAAQAKFCNQPEELAKKFNEAFPVQNDKEATDLIACVQKALPGVNLGEISTFDKSSELCNYTRGSPICGKPCSHTVNSCHYGGGSGTTGARAVDFGNEAVGDQIIKAANACGIKSARCETNGGVSVGCNSGIATHVHVSTKSCDKR